MAILNLNDDQLDVIYGALGEIEGVDEEQDKIISEIQALIYNSHENNWWTLKNRS